MSSENEVKKSVGLVQADVESNCIEHGVRGILHHEDIEKMIANYSEEDKQARIYGKFQHLTGLVFKEFDRKIHVIKPFTITSNDFTVYEAFDPHPRNPDAVLWVAVDRKGTRYVVNEIYQAGLPTEELAYRIKRVASQYRIESRVIDPSAYIEDQHTGKSLQGNLGLLGLSYTEGSKRRMDATKVIRDNLAFDMEDNFLKTPPQLYIFDSCIRLIWEMEHWQYQEWTGKAKEKRGQSEKPLDKDDHEIENLGRILLLDPQFIENYREQNYAEVTQFDPYR